MVTTQPTSERTEPDQASSPRTIKSHRYLLGFVIGSGAGGLIGWLIDGAMTSTPYMGVRIGTFVGGLVGGVLGGGAGWKGIAIVFSMVLFSAGGAGLALILWNPDPNSLLMLIPAGIGGIVGAFVGLAIAIEFFINRPARHRQKEPVNRIPKILVIVFVIIAVCSVATRLVINGGNASRAQLDVRNTGSNPVMLRHRGNDLVVRPGEVGSLRFSPGDTLTIFAGEDETLESKSVQLEARGTHQGSPAASSRRAADVNAVDGSKIIFRYADGM